MKTSPYCSIIVLNYQGEKVIKRCIDSLLEINYPKDKYEIIIVDNNSSDKSKSIIRRLTKRSNNIRTIFLNKNLGFSRGNNNGVKQSRGKYVILLNNDCIVEKDWLKGLVEIAEKDKKIFAVNSRILLFPKFFTFKIKNNFSEINFEEAFLFKSKLYDYTKDKKIKCKILNFPNFSEIEVPFDPERDKEIFLTMVINLAYENKSLIPKLKMGINSQLNKQNFKIISCYKRKQKLFFKIKRNIKTVTNFYDKIQNAGIVVFDNGGGRDIGAVVRYYQQDYEIDKGQHDNISDIYAACGAASLFRKDVWEKLGGLDERFFMYYEDVDISERARLLGYKIKYSPKAVIRHIHALSSKEWSPFFIYHSEKGRLLHMFFNFPSSIVFSEFLHFAFVSFLRIIKGFKKPKEFLKEVQYFKIVLYFVFNFFSLIRARYIRFKYIEKNASADNYKQIISGCWYFKENRK